MEKQQHSKGTRAHLLKCGKSGRCTGRDETQLKTLRPRFPFAMECGFESCKAFSRPLHCFEHGCLQFGMCCALLNGLGSRSVSHGMGMAQRWQASADTNAGARKQAAADWQFLRVSNCNSACWEACLELLGFVLQSSTSSSGRRHDTTAARVRARTRRSHR